MDTAERTLVLSWSGVLVRLLGGQVSFDELDGALYYFGCMRKYAIAPWRYQVGRGQLAAFAGGDRVRGQEVHRQLMELVVQAEGEDRVAWRDDVGVNSNYPQLNELLSRHDLPPIPIQFGGFDINFGYVEKAVEKHRLPYKLIC